MRGSSLFCRDRVMASSSNHEAKRGIACTRRRTSGRMRRQHCRQHGSAFSADVLRISERLFAVSGTGAGRPRPFKHRRRRHSDGVRRGPTSSVQLGPCANVYKHRYDLAVGVVYTAKGCYTRANSLTPANIFPLQFRPWKSLSSGSALARRTIAYARRTLMLFLASLREKPPLRFSASYEWG
jgi:hypothetical protein